MSNYSQLKAAIQGAVYTNGNNEITGAGLQSVLLQIANTVGEGYVFKGVATPGTSAGTPDANVFYIAPAGSYSNFGSSYTIGNGELGIFTYNGAWSKTKILYKIVDNLSSESDEEILSANQGRILSERLNNVETNYLTEIPTTTADIEFADRDENILVRFNGGHLETKNFRSSRVPYEDVATDADLDLTDKLGNILVRFYNGHIQTKYFDSSNIANRVSGLLNVPTQSIPLYLTCNDMDKSNRWGIGGRNKSLRIYLDHFFYTDREIDAKFNDGATSYIFSQDITGTNNSWNNGLQKYVRQYSLSVGDDTIPITLNSVLNSATASLFPKVLQIGDSVTEGWFANYPSVSGAPVQSWSWAKYYFEKDKQENGSGYDSLFVGSRTENVVNYDGVSYKSYAYGWGGKTAKWFCTGNDSPFNSGGSFSLTSYLNKYKTLADDGVTRLVPGSTAGTEVVDATAWDLCTPNVVVIQLGTNDTLSDWKTYIPQIVSGIRSEFQNMKIIISVLDGCTCNYPSLYPNYSGIFFDNYNSVHTRLMDAYCYAVDNWQDENNGIYVLYSGAVMPMPYSCNVRETDGYFDNEGKNYIGVDSIERVPHPSRYAHQEIGYLLYSAIKWALL